tara:strand:- start:41556 stop:42290 length:735 start_codon:yes stop_codon:yes gene_type:complete
MPATNFSDNRISHNLRNMSRVKLNIIVDVDSVLNSVSERIQRDIFLTVHDLLEQSGLILEKEAEVPILNIYTAIRVFNEQFTNRVLFGFRVETVLRENVSLRFGKTDPKDVLLADTWRHRTELRFVPFDEAREDSSSQALDEIVQQIRSFIQDWADANPKFSKIKVNEKDNFVALIDGVGPVFEQRLNSSGIQNLHELANLTDDEIQLLAPLFTVKDGSGNPIGTPGEQRLKDFRKKAQLIIAA